MTTEIIPWQAFLEVFRNQPKAKSNEWLANWCFDEQGAFFLFGPPAPQDELCRRLETAVVEFITLQSSSQTLH